MDIVVSLFVFFSSSAFNRIIDCFSSTDPVEIL
jgi:hypothetical protein